MPHRVLIVDDEATLARNIKTYLQRSGYRVEVAGSAEEGLVLFDRFTPDAVVLDLRLPGMDGLTALPRFRALNPEVVVILATGCGTLETTVEALNAGAYEVLAKPVPLRTLRLLLEEALGRGEARPKAPLAKRSKFLNADC
jgi:two-component system, NtrC family, response regulator AtoC